MNININKKISSTSYGSDSSSSDSDDESSTQLELLRVCDKLEEDARKKRREQEWTNDTTKGDDVANDSRLCPSVAIASNDTVIRTDAPTSCGTTIVDNNGSLEQKEPREKHQQVRLRFIRGEKVEKDEDASEFSDDSEDNSKLIRLLESFNQNKEESRIADTTTTTTTTDKSKSDDISMSSSSPSSFLSCSSSSSSSRKPTRKSTTSNDIKNDCVCDDDDDDDRTSMSTTPANEEHGAKTSIKVARRTSEQDAKNPKALPFLPQDSTNLSFQKYDPISKSNLYNPYLRSSRTTEKKFEIPVGIDTIKSRSMNRKTDSPCKNSKVLIPTRADNINIQPLNQRNTSLLKNNDAEIPVIIDVDKAQLEKSGFHDGDDLTVSIDSAIDSSKPSATMQRPQSQRTSQVIQQDRSACLPVRDPWQQNASEDPEVDPSLFAASPYKRRDPPRVCFYNEATRPLNSRQKIPVSGVFNRPYSFMWPPNKIMEFNHFQTEMSNLIRHSDDNIVVSAPTGAGKSTIFDMAMARFFEIDISISSQQVVSKARKILYVAPSKALCEERYEDWSSRLKAMNIGVEVALITGDAADPGSSFSDLTSAHLVISTPEKWDSMTRRWSENFFLFASVKLLLLDEVHLLGDLNRGWCLESVVTRMKTIHCATQRLHVSQDEINESSYSATNPDAIHSSFRMIAVSATLPNIRDVADFLMANEAHVFDDTYRPVPLRKEVLSMGKIGKNEWKFWSNMSQYVPDIVQKNSNGKQALIFCHTKKETQNIAEILIQRRTFGNVRTTASPGTVRYFLDHGVAFHHAGLDKEDRKVIEQAFADGKIKCLTCTSTLAVGVNLPAHLVVIVGTRSWRGSGGYEEIPIPQMMQMIGRAGRPGLDSMGQAIILTDYDSRDSIRQALEAGLGPAESKLSSFLPEAMNSEISQRSITSGENAIRWFQTTFLFACLKNNRTTDPTVVGRSMCVEALNRLEEIGIIQQDHEYVSPREGSHIMNQHYLSFETMKMISSLPSDVTQCQLLRSISMLETLHSPVRRNEKKELKEIHKADIVKYKLCSGGLSKFTVQDPSQKAFLLLQSNIAMHRFSNKNLMNEMETMTTAATKILQAAQEYSIKASKFGEVAKQCFLLHRALVVCLWSADSGVLNQIDNVGPLSTNKLRLAGINSFQKVLDSSEKQIELVTGRRSPFARELKAAAQSALHQRLNLSVEVEYTKSSNTPAGLIVNMRRPRDATMTMMKKQGGPEIEFTLLVYTESPKQCLVYEAALTKPSTFRIPLLCHFERLHVHLLSSIVGFDESRTVEGKLVASTTQNDATIGESGTSSARRDYYQNQTIVRKQGLQQMDISFSKNIRGQTEVDAIKQLSDPSPTITPPRELPLGRQKSGAERRKNERNLNGVQQDILDDPNLYLGRNLSDVFIPKQPPPETSLPPVNVTPFHQRPSNRVPYTSLERQMSQNIIGHYVEGWSNPSDLEAIAPSFENPENRCQNISQSATDRNGECGHNFGATDLITSSFFKSCSRYQGMPQTTMDDQSAQSRFSRGQPRVYDRQWKKSQKHVNRSQQRAFAKKSENPFFQYKHDPNNSEAHLEGLSLVRSAIIPQTKRLQDMMGGTTSKIFQRSKKRYRNENCDHLGGQQLLQQKAAEMENQSFQTLRSHRYPEFTPPLPPIGVRNEYRADDYTYPQMNSHENAPRCNLSGYASSREYETYHRSSGDRYGGQELPMYGERRETPLYLNTGRHDATQWQEHFQNRQLTPPHMQYRNKTWFGSDVCRSINDGVHDYRHGNVSEQPPQHIQNPQSFPTDRTLLDPSVPGNGEQKTLVQHRQEMQESPMLDDLGLFF